MRQSAKQLTLNNRLESIRAYLAHIENLFTTAELLTVFRQGLESYEQLCPNEKAMFHGKMLGFYSHHATGRQQVALGTLQQKDIAGIEEDFSRILGCPGSREWWLSVQAGFDDDPIIAELTERSTGKKTIRDLLGFLESTSADAGRRNAVDV